MKTPRFNIGDYVEALPSMLDYDNPKTQTKTTIKKGFGKKKGVIVGATYRFTGSYEKGSTYVGGYGSSYDDYDPPIFVPDKGILFWKIRQGWLNKTFEAIEEDIKLLYPVHIQCLREKEQIPWKFMGDRYKEQLSRQMKRQFKEHPDWFKRDEKGRFVKCV